VIWLSRLFFLKMWEKSAAFTSSPATVRTLFEEPGPWADKVTVVSPRKRAQTQRVATLKVEKLKGLGYCIAIDFPKANLVSISMRETPKKQGA
jgi:hypothetical protein